MILDHYGFFNLIKVQKMKRSITGKASSSKNAKVSYDQVAIAASSPKQQGIPEEIIGVELRKESQSTRLNENMHRDGILKEGQC